MADVWEKDLAQKSPLTTSDFIRVVGSDNVSYKQLVSGVMTAMGLDAIKTPASDVSNIDTATSTGFYRYGSGASGTKPNSSGGVLIVVAFNASYSQQVAIPYDTNNSSGVYKRAVYSGTPTAWQLQPTRAEVDDLNNKTLVTNASGAKNINLPVSYRGIMTIVDTTPSAVGMYIIYTTGSGNTGYKAILEVSGATLTGGANVLTYTPPSGRVSTIFIQNIAGTASV